MPIPNVKPVLPFPPQGLIMTTTSNYTQDPAAQLVGIHIEEARPGYASASLTIRPEHLNGLGTVHGGIVFLLADTVFAYVCNARGVQTVASKCDITYHQPSQAGDTLSAVGEERYLKGRTGIYDVTVTNQNNSVVAHFRGHSMALKPV